MLNNPLLTDWHLWPPLLTWASIVCTYHRAEPVQVLLEVFILLSLAALLVQDLAFERKASQSNII